MQQLDEQLALVTGPAIKCVLTLAQLNLLARKIKYPDAMFSEVEEHELLMLASMFSNAVREYDADSTLEKVRGFAL